MSKSNCLFYALSKWLRYGGYIAIRRSRSTVIPYPHFLWIPSLDGVYVEHYAPIDSASEKASGIGLVWFSGEIRTEDKS